MNQPLTLYRVKNWADYNSILINRWNLDIWFDPKVLEKWYKPTSREQASHYSNQAILTCLTIRALFNLSLRATQGVISSLIRRLALPIECPHYSRLCRRSKGLARIQIPRKRGSRAFGIIVDSTGLKVYGPGEWHVKMHKSSKRRTWRKLHIAIDPVTQQIISSQLTSSRIGDSSAVPVLLKKLKDPIENLWADGAYDHGPIYKLLHEKKIVPLIRPRINSAPSRVKRYRRRLGRQRVVYEKPELKFRDQAIAYINQFFDLQEGMKEWKRGSGYSLRSLVETTIMRFKRTFTDKLRARKLENQQTEVFVKCCILNKMLEMGLPYTVPITYQKN
jgi:hypothetical protein